MFKLSASLVIFILLTMSCGSPATNKYDRIHNGNFEIAGKRFVPHSGNGPSITLQGIVHISEKSFYENIQRRLDAADLVLYEGVGKQGEVEEITQEVTDNCPENIDYLFPPIDHNSAAKQLNLVSQNTVLRYLGPQFKHADMSLREFWEASDEAGLALCVLVSRNVYQFQEALAAQKKADEAQRKLTPEVNRNILALVLSKSIERDRPNSTKEEPGLLTDSTVLFKRNDLVLAELRTQLPLFGAGKNIIVLYGAGHMPDLELELIKMNYRLENTEWLVAFSL